MLNIESAVVEYSTLLCIYSHNLIASSLPTCIHPHVTSPLSMPPSLARYTFLESGESLILTRSRQNGFHKVSPGPAWRLRDAQNVDCEREVSFKNNNSYSDSCWNFVLSSHCDYLRPTISAPDPPQSSHFASLARCSLSRCLVAIALID